MTAPSGKNFDEEDEYPETQPDDAPRADTPGFLDRGLPTMSVEVDIDPLTTTMPTDVLNSSNPYQHRPYPPNTGVPPRPQGGGPPVPMVQSSSSSAWTTSTVTYVLQPEGLPPMLVSSSPFVATTDGASPPSDFPRPFQGHRARLTPGGMYAAAAITPIVVLAIIAAIVYFCMRKRKRQRSEAVTAQNVEEMKKHPRSPMTAQAYMASPSGASPPYTVSNNHLLPPHNPALLQPIILGPIPSGANGAYFTGIDTSDVVSMSSASNLRPPPNPLSDNESLTEPPPPYRPRSVAPPSFSNSSRQSSFRATMPPPETSRTPLIEPSPFEDPFDDDDAVSELSGPTAGRSEDAMSAVSDLSYQNDPVVNRPTF